ncbi:intermembrane lipid transfer protein VPS13D-like [Glandiceps talaboti]
MLEGLAAWVLNTYVGEYLENLNTDQLSIGLLQGAVELENLPLKKDALRGLDLPVEVKAGFVGKITLQIPMRRLRSEPWVISIDKLYLVAGPVVQGEYNEEKEKERQQSQKQKQLDAIEEKWRAEKQGQVASSSWYSYSASLVTNIVENLQLNVKDVHIRYEDSATIPNQQFAFGITITELSAQSTDGSWVPKFVSRDSADMMFKLVELKDFAMYWDINTEFVGDLPMTELADALQRNMFKAKDKNVFQDHAYILQPVSAEAKFKRNLTALPLRSRNSPRLACELELQKIPLALAESQYRGILAMIKESERYDKARKYRKWRPMSKVKDSPSKWWKFAFNSILNKIKERNKRLQTSYVLKRAKDNVQYVEAYTQYLTNPTLTGDLMEHKEKTEIELTFDELRILREVAMERVRKEEALAVAAKEKIDSEQLQLQKEEQQYQSGTFQRWFPGWGGWYSSSSATPETSPTSTGMSAVDGTASLNKDEIEEEILDALGDNSDDDTFMKRDNIFALLTFSLQSGTFKLNEDSATTGSSVTKQGILELEFAGVNMSFESRPRSRSMLLNVSLGALYLRDLLTVDSIFPVLVSPQQNRDEISIQTRPPYFGRFTKSAETSSYVKPVQMMTAVKSEEALFVMTYEKRPPHSHADYRLEVTTRPLDIIYNPKPIRRVSEFFSSKQKGMSSRPSELHLTKAARIRYEELKNQTRAELLQAWDHMLEGETIQHHSKRWDVHLDISAPQIIVPDNFQAKDATLVVLDFGHLEFVNTNARGMMKKKAVKEERQEEEEEDPLDDDDDFATPLSTPPVEMDKDEIKDKLDETDTVTTASDVTSVDFSNSATSIISESAIKEKFYDKYTLDMSDLQVLVGKAKDNWKSAHFKGTSALHVVDRFTISVQLERRIIYSSDPELPSATLAGTLPKLVLHINENKILALNKCVKLLSNPKQEGLLSTSNKSGLPSVPSDDSLSELSDDRDYSFLELESTQQTSREILVESKQLLMQFSVDQVSLEVQSRGRSIAELQVSGVKGHLTKRPFDMSVSLTVHGLLLVDALQTFGHGYELLMASHKSLSLDIPSGTILDSDPSSPKSPPNSPTSPMSRGSPTESTPKTATKTASQSSLASAFAALDQTSTPDPGGGMESVFQTEAIDTEALITIEFEMISPNCATLTSSENETLQIASLQFNNLDVIANQETIVELLGFFKRVAPSSKKKLSGQRMKESNLSVSTEQINKIASESVRTEVTADFHRLNLLLLRGVRRNDKVEARKVGTATMTGAHIQASLGTEFNIEGHLGGLQVVDLTPEGASHSKVFSVGHDPQVDSSAADMESCHIPEEMFNTAFGTDVFDNTDADVNFVNKAFYFSFYKPKGGSQPSTPYEIGSKSGLVMDFNSKSPPSSPQSSENSGTELKLRMASLCYTHSPRFIAELSSCASEFKMYTSSLAVSIKQAATEVAKGIVTKKDYLSTSLGPAGFSSSISVVDSPLRKSTMSLNESLINAEGGDLDDSNLNQSRLKLDIVMQTPVVAFPRTPTSDELLVGHLGKIYLHNTVKKSGAVSSDRWLNDGIERMYMEIRNINVFSINSDYLNRQARSGQRLDSKMSAETMMATRRGDSILHNTTIELTIDQISADSVFVNRDEAADIHFQDEQMEASQNILKVTGKVVTPLKVVLAKQVFEQVLQTLDNLTFDGSIESSVDVRDDVSIAPATSVTSLSSVQSDDFDPDRKSVRFEEDEKTTNAASESLPSPVQDTPMKIQAEFSLPVLDVTLHDDFGDGNQGFVELAFKDFMVNMEKATPYTTSIQVALGSLIMEDLLQPQDSKHRFLMVSTVTSQSSPRESRSYLSTSCPIKVARPPVHMMTSSLPTNLQSKYERRTKKITVLHPPPRSRSATYSDTFPDTCPATPPPSVRASAEDLADESSHDALVHINVLLVDKKCPEFHSTYRGINRLVDVDFNSLDTTVNLQTWVVLLTFFSIGTPKGKTTSSPNDYVSANLTPSDDDGDVEIISPYIGSPVEEEKNSEFDIKVQSLTLILNKPKYELASANVSKLIAHLGLIDGNTSIAGSLGQISLTDLTPSGHLYRERFITTGKEALGFDIFKYGPDDPYLTRECDIKVQLRMASVQYVHTHRFLSETVAFCEHFNNLHNHMGHTSAISKGKDVEIKDSKKTASRIILDIEAGSPVILFPKNSSSSEVLVVNLGNLTVKNEFLYAGSPGSISVILKDIDVPTEIGGKVKFYDRDSPTSMKDDKQHDPKSPEGVVYTINDGPLGNLSNPKPSPTSQHKESKMPNLNLRKGFSDTDVTSAQTSSASYYSTQQAMSSVDVSSMSSQPSGKSLSDKPGGTPITASQSQPAVSMPSSSRQSSVSMLDQPKGASTPIVASQSQPAIGKPLFGSQSSPDKLQGTSTSVSSPPPSSESSATNFESFHHTECPLNLQHISCATAEGGPTPLTHRCLLDVMHIDLVDMDLYSAERTDADDKTKEREKSGMVFPSFIVQRKGGKLLKEKCILKLQVERNLNADYSRIVPNFSINGMLSSVHCSMDIMQYNLIRGFLDKNLGEPLEEFEKPVTSYSQEPVGHTVLSGTVWPNISMVIDLDNVSLEFLIAHEQANCSEASLARIDFIKSKFSFENFSDGSKTVDLVSHAIVAHDTRYQDVAEDSKPNVFIEILSPTKQKIDTNSLQMELHYRSTNDFSRFTVLLNNMRVMGIIDWLLAVKDFLDNQEDKKDETEDTTESTNIQTSKTQVKSGDQLQKEMFPNLAQDKSDMDWGPKELMGFRRETSSPGSNRGSSPGSRCSSPVTVGSGIITKRAPMPEQPDKPFEMKLNITETEFVVVENMACWDTSAVILKSTAVLTYKPAGTERPMSCSLQSLEVFSCNLSSEDDTALSIIDPVTVTMELNSSPTYKQTSGLLDATTVLDAEPSLEVQIMQALNIRLSYHDIKLFMAILNSLPKQATQAVSQDALHRPSSPLPPSGIDESLISKLEDLGFRRADCIQALEICSDRIEVAATWLLENATPVVPVKMKSQKSIEEDDESQKGGFVLSGVEIRANNVCICLIDDCKDCDVPLAELSLVNPYFLQKLHGEKEGNAHFSLSGDYYNRHLSGWEPFLETWRCRVTWKHQQPISTNPGRQIVEVKTKSRLDLNLTSSLMKLYSNTKKNWTEDYYNKHSLSSDLKRRQPFVPYALRNHTGCRLEFATRTSVSTGVTGNRAASVVQPTSDNQQKISEWKEVEPGEEIPFVFESRGKLRHRSTHELKVHQIVVRVDGWQATSAVSVDKVGTVFRPVRAKPQAKTSTMYSEKPPARVVFDITLEGSARKVVTVRSSLMVVSRVSVPMELRLVHPSSNLSSERINLPVLEPHATLAVPMDLTFWNLYVRPGQNWGVEYPENPIHWRTVVKPGDSASKIVECLRPSSEKGGNFRLCVNTRRDGFPADYPTARGTDSPRIDSAQQPGHTITLLPPVTLTNLLPYELRYYVKGFDIKGRIRPGKDEPVYQVDLSQPTEFGFLLENYSKCRELVIPENFYRDYKVQIRVEDSQKRQLYLNINIEPRAGKSLKISVSAPYWLINKSGLPLIFKQDSTKIEAAGQSEEYEMARSLAPFLFSYADKECPYLCAMRLGKGVHENGYASFCARFSLEGGTSVRSLHIQQGGGRPDWVYNIGFDIRKGLGRYCDTQIVTFVPRYQLDNRSRFKLAFAQRHLVVGTKSSDEGRHLAALSGSSVYFHWPRDDLDRLLCVRINDIPDCRWSGGFRIDRTVSFHVNIRDKNGNCILLHVEIAMRGATYFVVFTDGDQVPPPYRIDNMSEVPVQFYQSNESLRTILKPKTSVPYAWDESTLQPVLTCAVQGGSRGTYSFNKLEEGEKLFYENFIYIGFMHTFQTTQDPATSSRNITDVQYGELVLDVCDGNVVMKKKTPGKRSQLWRMTSQGLLRHEGSSPPRHPNQSSSSGGGYIDGLVLDTANLSFSPNAFVPLKLSKPDERRQKHQTWYFTKHGRLCCGLGGLFVQAKDGVLTEGNIPVLGPGSHSDKIQIPAAQNVCRQKLRPGSGVLTCRIIADGPTRVLQITDINMRQLIQKEDSGNEWVVVEEKGQQRQRQLSSSSHTEDNKDQQDNELQVLVDLERGIGVSIINKVPEELVFMTFRGIEVDYTRTAEGTNLDARVYDIQVDNQLINTHRTATLYVTPERQDGNISTTPTPALNLTMSKVHSKVPTYELYKRFMLQVKRMTLIIEELLLFKLLAFAGYGQSDAEMEQLDENDYDQQRSLAAEKQPKRYYFESLKLHATQIKLSMLRGKLPPQLQTLKTKLGIPLVGFEDAHVDLDPFVKIHPFERRSILISAILTHYAEELKSQAAKILGSVDFLGNPVGLLSDVAGGVSDLVKHGNIVGLVENVTHGVSNSAAKVTGSLSDGIGTITMDSKHQEIREVIRSSHGGRSRDHMVAGLKGLGFGIVGGLTSVFTQTYEGASQDGVEGLIKGLGKGVIGTLTKPAAGVLDFAAGAAAAVRDSSKSGNGQPLRVRHPRCCIGPDGTLIRYSRQNAEGQDRLLQLNDGDPMERFLAFEELRSGLSSSSSGKLSVLVSTEGVYFLGGDRSTSLVLQTQYSEFYGAQYMEKDDKYYIELTVKGDTEMGVRLPPHHQVKRPQVACDSSDIAKKVTQWINYAKNQYDELQQVLADTGADLYTKLQL